MLPLLVLLTLADVSPQTSEAISRAAALAAGEDARFDVTSELDLQDAVDHEAQRQLCGATSESCAAQLADAIDARLLLFLRVYLVADVAHVALTLRDVKQNRVLHRSDVSGDEAALFAQTQQATRDIVTRFTDHPAEGRTKLFIGRAAVDAAAVAPASPAPPSAGPSPLFLGGVATAGVGALVGVGGVIVGLAANGVLGDPDSEKQDKNNAEPLRVAGYAGAGVGAAVAVAGVALAALGGGE